MVVSLGEGAWRGSMGWGMDRSCFGHDLSLLCQLEADGQPVLISDESWQASQSGPLGRNDTMRLEEYDARKTITDLHAVKVENFGFDTLIGSCLPVTAHERFKAKVITTPKGETILDFGQNFAGYVEIDVTACGGETITLSHTEVLDRDGNYQSMSFQNPDCPLCLQQVIYTCKEGRNRWHQQKCYYGFRYVKVETDLPITGEEFTGVAVYSDMEETAGFTCGVEDVNQLFRNTVWSMKSNFVDIPTDCPTREKAGFAGDCQVFSHTALYLMDCLPVLERWLKEQAISQMEDGCIKQRVPTRPGRDYYDGSAGWSNAFDIIPYRIMKRYDSLALVQELYPQLRRWILFLLERAKPFRPENEAMPADIRDYFVYRANHWGEWCEPGVNPLDYFAERDRTGHPELGTSFLAQACLLASRMAKRLGEEADAALFRDGYEKARNAYRYAFIKNGRVEGERQCLYVRAIAHELLSEEEKLTAAADLAQVIRHNGNRLGTGFLSTCELCNVLTDYGQAETAFDLLLQTNRPSWLYEVQKGATTMWESWFGMDDEGNSIGSFNHYSFGSVSGWLMSRVLGIVVEDGSITIKPSTDARLGHAEGYYRSPLGMIRSAWAYRDDGIAFTVEIPANLTACVILPDGSRREVSTGRHEFVIN